MLALVCVLLYIASHKVNQAVFCIANVLFAHEDWAQM